MLFMRMNPELLVLLREGPPEEITDLGRDHLGRVCQPDYSQLIYLWRKFSLKENECRVGSQTLQQRGSAGVFE